jgi:hypothetical protein
MARAQQKEQIGELQSQSDFSPVLLKSICLRCGGLMVKEFSLDLLNSSSELECATKRCVQCGDILDPVILRNRCIGQQPTTVQHARQSLGRTGSSVR